MNYKKINKSFKKYKLKKSNESMADICKPKNFKLQPQQLFLADLFKQTKIRGLLIYHKIGAGKTCTAISIAERLKKNMKIVVVLPAALIGNFEDELRSPCGNNNYITSEEVEQLNKLKPRNKMYKKIIENSERRINKHYKIYSYHKFTELVNLNKIKLTNTLLIIDEVQNMISDGGIFYRNLSKVINNSDKKTRIILLSATPMFDKPVEIALTLNLLKDKNNKIPIGNNFNQTFLKQKKTKEGIIYSLDNKDVLMKHFKGLISYYRGAPKVAFPKANIKFVNCNMSEFQYKSYLTSLSSTKDYIKGSFRDVDLLKLPLNFLIGPRIVSNIAFPNKSFGQKGFSSFKGTYLLKKNVKKYSIKFYKLYNKLKKSTGPVFIYSNFKEEGGLKSLIRFLEYQGFKNYKDYGEGNKRYALWSGDERRIVKEDIKKTFNNSNNKNGEMIKIILGSPSIKEGVSLLRVDQVHILEPYWNMSRIKQIIGRAIRFCSHKDLSPSKRKVDIYIYIATYKNITTADQNILLMAKKKQDLIDQFEKILKEMAIDCKLFYARNVYKNDKKLECFK